jgi:hypothetical protein
MSRERIAQQIRTLADQIRCEDPDTASSLYVVEGAVWEGHEDMLSDLLSQYADHRLASMRAQDN